MQRKTARGKLCGDKPCEMSNQKDVSVSMLRVSCVQQQKTKRQRGRNKNERI